MVSTVIGEEIKINNGKNMKGSINIEGNTYQEVEDGKNKAIIPDREETFNGMSINIKNGIINITGKSSVTYTSYRIVGSAELEAGKTYYLRLFGNKSGSASLRNDTESVWFPDSENNENQFTPTVGGTYNIQLGFGSGENQNWNARYSISETSNADWVEGKEATPTLENPSEVQAVGDSGSVEIKKTNKNWLPYDLFPTTTINGVTFTNNPDGTIKANGTATANAFYRQDVTLQAGDYLLTGSPADAENSKYCIQAMGYGIGDFGEGQSFSLSKETAVPIRLMVWQGVTVNNIIFKPMIESGNSKTEFIKHEGNTYTIPVQKPFYKLGDYADKFVKQDGKWYEQHYIKEYDITGNESWNKSTAINAINRFTLIITDLLNGMPETADTFSNSFKAIKYSDAQSQLGITHNSQLLIINHSFSENETITLEQFKTKLQNLYNAGTPVKVYYVLAIPELIECTEEQSQILEQLNNLYLYEGMNYIYSTNELSPIFQFSYDKIINDFKFYLSENGRLIFPNENISFLCSISESSIPSMPEALETSATIAGRDGDVSLSTTYGPMSFELVLYTEDNLTPEEKLKQEIFLNRFCNSIKNSTETFALELAQKFYKIKYNGLLNKENYPKFLRFTLPFKSSKSFAYDVKKHIIYGNSTVESNTIEPTGFECVIKGPAIKPIISLNDYSIEYNNTILDDESLIIDTNNSTAVLVNSEGTRVNAMRYYNHQFPKILNGENELKILSGIDNPENVSISWYDLTL